MFNEVEVTVTALCFSSKSSRCRSAWIRTLDATKESIAVVCTTCVLPDDVVSARRVWRVRWCVNGSGVSVLRCTALLPTACLVCDSAVLLGDVFALVGAVVAVAVAERAEQKRIESKRKES